EVDTVAVGALSGDGGKWAGLVLVGYKRMGDDREAEAAAVKDRINDARSLRDLPPLPVLDEVKSNHDEARQQVEAGIDPMYVLNSLMETAVTGSPTVKARGWVLITDDLTAFKTPRELLNPDMLTLNVVVAQRRFSGHPWAHYVLLVVAVEGRSLG